MNWSKNKINKLIDDLNLNKSASIGVKEALVRNQSAGISNSNASQMSDFLEKRKPKNKKSKSQQLEFDFMIDDSDDISSTKKTS